MFRNKKVIIVGSIVVLVILGTLVLFVNNNNKNNKVALNDNKDVVDIKKDVEISNFNEITVESARIEKHDKVSDIFIKIKNNTNEVIANSDLKLTIYDNSNEVLLVSHIKGVDKIEVGESREFQVSTLYDISNASKYVVEKTSD